MSLPKPYYEESGIVIYNADCREILPHLPPVDLVLTDPPYGIGFSEYESYRDREEDYGHFLWPIIEASERLVTNGWVVVFQAAKKCREWHMLFPRPFRIIACPKTFVQIFQVTGPTWATDYALFWPSGFPTQKGVGRDWFVSDTANMRFDRGHPCARPLAQIKYLVPSFSDAGETILDPFMGSGTTLVAAKQLGRRAIGVEIEERYCEIAAERLRQQVLDFGPAPEPEGVQEELFGGDGA